ncbi:hypothetical protein [Streptomyces sp. NBC_01483]|uniref:hypothetical protein n=1 Tax=Streptomyces sp. NBC_01483 TaxID=2903883 RepID=UPI002E36B3D7|nr:hypothetical protein [Streptomyces sp. NBC_01483]
MSQNKQVVWQAGLAGVNHLEHGPAGPAFWRFGREDRQNLWDATGNPRRDV